ncbi:MAG: hypothetical protein ABI548_14475 [Polyangiaceae bacterium]
MSNSGDPEPSAGTGSAGIGGSAGDGTGGTSDGSERCAAGAAGVGLGCYADNAGVWVETPCSCELPLANPSHGTTTVNILLSVGPADVTPSLTGAQVVTFSVTDPGLAWYDLWSKQSGNERDFSLSAEGGRTTVRLGASTVALSPVSLADCESRRTSASVSGSFSAVLSMQGTFTDQSGKQLGTSVGSCHSMIHP